MKKYRKIFSVLVLLTLLLSIILSGCKEIQKAQSEQQVQQNQEPAVREVKKIQPKEEEEVQRIPAPNLVPSPTPVENKTALENKQETPAEIPAGSIALFFTEGLSSIKKRLPVQVQYTDIEGGGYATDIRWETSVNAIVRYLPELEKVDLLKKATSASWSQNVLYPFTTAGRFFVLRDWGSDWDADNSQWTLYEIDAKTGEQLSETGFNTDSFAVVGNKIYLSTGRTTDFYGRVTSYGKLEVMNLGESSSYNARELLKYSEQNPSGTLYGVGDGLMAVSWDYMGEQMVIDIYSINPDSGIRTKLYENLMVDDFSFSNIYPGKDALYILTKNGNKVFINRYPLLGEPQSLLEVELEGEEQNVYVAEDDEQLGIFIARKDWKVHSMILYDLKTKESRGIVIEPFSVDASFNRVGFPFLVIE
ncbi:hypothetical protein HYX13_02745 [Candidatus Woesearchaeota archaeon]|nr:hypothetical protein [Candidatus Woesearchaeota archaeon]